MENLIEFLDQLEVESVQLMTRLLTEGKDVTEETRIFYRQFEEKKAQAIEVLKQWITIPVLSIDIEFLARKQKIVIQTEDCQVTLELSEIMHVNGGKAMELDISMSFFHVKDKQKIMDSVQQFIDRMGYEIVTAKKHKLRAVFQEKYLSIPPVSCMDMFLTETQNRVRQLCLQKKECGEIAAELSIPEEEVRECLYWLSVKVAI